MNEKISVAKDLTWIFTVVDVGHIFPMPCLESPCTIEYVPGPNTYRHMLARSVMHENSAVAQGFHDCGRFIFHTPPDTVPGFLMSQRQIMFSAMKVQVESQPIGFANIITPMLTCGLIPLPVGWNMDASSHTVIVGMEFFWDYVLCWRGVFIDIQVAVAMFAFDLLTLKPASGPLRVILFEGVKELLKAIGVDEATRFASPGQRYVERARSLRGTPLEPRVYADNPLDWDML